MSMNNPISTGSEGTYPAKEDLQTFIGRRKSIGLAWQIVFQISTLIGILALIALLYNILNSAFGYVAVQNVVDPTDLVVKIQEERMLGLDGTLSSENDDSLARGIGARTNAIGFFGYAYYQANQDTLRAVPIDGVSPSAETAESNEYPFSRPLFIYTSGDVLEDKPQVADFVNFYLNTVNDEIEEVGYFPSSAETLAASRVALAQALDLESAADLTEVSPAASSGDILIAGSSTVFPLTEQIAQQYTAAGFEGNIVVESVGSSAGFRRFCFDEDIDIANASRAIQSGERAVCTNNLHQPVEMRIGTDALAIVVSRDNDFVDGLTQDQLRQIFTEARYWSDINPAWPGPTADDPENGEIRRLIPGIDSGTLDFFAETVFDVDLEALDKDTLVSILQTATDDNGRLIVSAGKLRQLENEQLFYEDQLLTLDPERHAAECASGEPPARCSLPPRTQEEVYQVVLAEVIQPRVVASWSLVESVFNRDAIATEIAGNHPDAEMVFRSWLTVDFVTSPQSSTPELAGVRTAIFGSLWVILITIMVAFPLGVGAAIYLEEYANDIRSPFLRRVNSIIQTNINNLAGVPSIIYGMLGLAVFVRIMEPFTSGRLFGAVADPTTANGRTILSAGMTLALLILPLIIINAQEAIRAVPSSLRQASYGLGATKWQTIWHHVLPNALPGILTGTILAMSRAVGETAPLVVIGASTAIFVDPSGPFSKFTVLPIQIYQWTARPQDEFRNIAAAAIIVLLILLLTLNATAVLLRNRFSRSL